MKTVIRYVCLFVIGVSIPILSYRYGFIDGRDEMLKLAKIYAERLIESQKQLDQCEKTKPFYDVFPESPKVKAKRKT